MDQLEDDFQIKVDVELPELKAELGGANKYHVYHIHGQDKFSEFTIYRRYSDFVILKTAMLSRWPGIYIPALPEKKLLGNNDLTFIETRRRGLSGFLSEISRVKFIWYGDEFQLFIKNNISDVEKSLGNLGKTNNKQISTKYSRIFDHVLSSETSIDQQAKNSARIQQFKAYLKNAHIVLEKVAKVSEQMCEARRRYNERYLHILSPFFPDFEDKCIAHYTQNKEALHFSHHNDNGISDSLKVFTKSQARTSMLIANELIKEEIREIENFNEILRHKDEYETARNKALAKVKDYELEETKINSGKESIMSKIKSMNKEQQLKGNQALLEKAEEELKDAEQICRVVDGVLSGDQIQRFKELRKQNYYKVLREIVKTEKQAIEAEQEIWTMFSSQTSEEESGSKNAQVQGVATNVESAKKSEDLNQEQYLQK